MTIARRQQVDLSITPYYHCVSRCVRRSFLCGIDAVSGRSYEHRRQWLESRILKLAQIYCIDICAYAVMSNHYHLVVHINRDKALNLSEEEVIQRWSIQHSLDEIMIRYRDQNIEDPQIKESCQKQIHVWRERLYSLSWMMRELNMAIALQANKEDQCTGHFWEGRYKSQALLDEQALLAAMTYVDLNPIRANIAQTPETSDHTSIKKRINSFSLNAKTPIGLAPFRRHTNSSQHGYYLPFNFTDYLEWIDWYGRHNHHLTARGEIDIKQPPILARLSIAIPDFITTCANLEQRGRLWVGSRQTIEKTKHLIPRQRLQTVNF
ncbi:transposase [Vibrio sp. CAIM 722]|uniref:Transposase n=1 Tax=Vibrio eleionomae TaxID=2653505 RepID=A0A7X4LL07_9VIBR|nr:transposase [Vibrio eleionomae]MZI93740.1 transposase [Vibrio eleionomae]